MKLVLYNDTIFLTTNDIKSRYDIEYKDNHFLMDTIIRRPNLAKKLVDDWANCKKVYRQCSGKLTATAKVIYGDETRLINTSTKNILFKIYEEQGFSKRRNSDSVPF